MAAGTTNSRTLEVKIQMRTLDSARSKGLLLHLLGDTKEAREKYMMVGVPLYKLALTGNWKDAKCVLEKDPMLVTTAITKGWATLLHVAAGANRVHFVEQLVKLMEDDDLELQDCNGNTAFFLAAGVGNPRLAEIMVYKNKSLPTIRGKNGVTPLHFAVIQGKSEMARFLYHNTKITQIFQERDWVILFLTCINAEIYDLALHMLEKNEGLALARDDNHDTGLHLLARKHLPKSIMKHTQVFQLVSRLWKIILTTVNSESEIHKIIRNPSPFVLDAALIGNFEFLAELLSTYPDLIWERDCQNRSIIHIAVLNRHARIFNLIHEISSIKDFIITLVDDDKNNLLHLAAKLAPPEQLNLVSGAAFQLMLELLWFEEVKKIMLPLDIEVINSEGITPAQLFTREHKELLRRAEYWVRDTDKSCLLVSIIIVIGVFVAAFILPNGNGDNSETSIYFKKPAFVVFIISEGIALISSTTSTIVFLSMLISRYAEYDFYKSLPLKLIFGLLALFVSITSMMVAFSSGLFVTYYHGSTWVPSLISVVAFLLIPLFGYLQFPLWFDILYSSYYHRSSFRPNKSNGLICRGS